MGLRYQYTFHVPPVGALAGAPAATAAVTGTAIGGITASQIIAGGRTIIITLTSDTWVTAGATFDAQRANIAAGIDSAQAEGAGWDAVVKAGIDVGDVVRTSDTVVTVTLDAEAGYLITAPETITVTVPASALTGGVGIVATPTFNVYPLVAMMPPNMHRGAYQYIRVFERVATARTKATRVQRLQRLRNRPLTAWAPKLAGAGNASHPRIKVPWRIWTIRR